MSSEKPPLLDHEECPFCGHAGGSHAREHSLASKSGCVARVELAGRDNVLVRCACPRLRAPLRGTVQPRPTEVK